jgi:hypothetical protein
VLGQVFPEYFSFPCQSSFHQLLHSHHHLSSGARQMGQLVAAVPSGHSLTPLRIIIKNVEQLAEQYLMYCVEIRTEAQQFSAPYGRRLNEMLVRARLN